VKKIIAKVPANRQTLFFSATMPDAIVKLTHTILKNPIKVSVTPDTSAAETVRQELYYVDKANKGALLIHLLDKHKVESALVFTRTKHGADKVTRLIQEAGIKAEAIHGNKSQNARQSALASFKAKKTRVLVATDLASRGIDIDELSHVINFEIPNIPETYVHRIGRTGRAGLSGIALSFSDAEESEFIRDINKLLKGPIPVVDEHPFPMKIMPLPKQQKRGPGGRSGSFRSKGRAFYGRGRRTR
jgi:ATP-dependent RNA helicase RhlE